MDYQFLFDATICFSISVVVAVVIAGIVAIDSKDRKDRGE
jgi:hypothetical protein